jgi:uncharacterized protein YcfJ
MPTNSSQKKSRGHQIHPDPITGEPGAHPLGTGLGAAAGGVSGAAIGSMGGPIGTAVGAVIGAIAGGLAGKGMAELVDPSAEDAYWRERHGTQPYVNPNHPYEAYAPAYRAGYTGYREGKSFQDREAELRMEYEGGPQKAQADAAQAGIDSMMPPITVQHHMGTHPLRWEEAREAARAAYERVGRSEAYRTEKTIITE